MIRDAMNPNFGLPDMGDYYYDAPDQEIMLGNMNRAINSCRRDKANDASAYKFYSEEPPAPGFNKNNKTYTFDVALGPHDGIGDSSETVAGLSVSDGDTISIPMEKITAGDDASQKYLDAVQEWSASHGKDGSSALTLRFAGIDCKELPHFRKASLDDLPSDRKTINLSNDIMANDDYIVSRYKSWMEDRAQLKDDTAYDGTKVKGTFFTYNDAEEVKDEKHAGALMNVVKLEDGKYHQYFTPGDGNAYVLQKCDSNDYDPNTIADAGLARDVVCNALDNADTMRIVVDGTQITRDGTNLTTEFGSNPYDQDLINKAKQALDSAFDADTIYKKPGFNLWGQDAYGRCIAAIYVRINGKWINLNKLVIADTNKTEINKYNAPGDGSTGVDTTSYEYDAKEYADSIYADSKKFDDRQKIQEDLFSRIGKQQTWKQLKEWTVTIGDVTLFVPPTSIRCITQTKADRLAVVRAKGAMAKSGTKAQRILEMDLYFNEDRGINGFEYETTTRPDGKGNKITYWMNGLRALYAQFRVAPFLPIDNYYINTVLGIDGVTMVNFACETVPNFPRLLKATIQMAEFEYRIYMPEIPSDDGDDNETDDDTTNDNDGIRNYFAEQINYPLFRYYYQRLIQNGENLKNTKFLDTKFIKSTFGNKTCLIPAKFMDPYIKFYVPNRDQLMQMKKAKIARLTQPNTARSLTDNEKKFCKDMAKIKNELDYLSIGDSEAVGSLQAVNDLLSDPQYDDCILTTDKNGNPEIISLSGADTSNVNDIFRKDMDAAAAAYEAGLYQLRTDDGMPLIQNVGTRSWSMYHGTGDDSSYTLNYNMTFNVETHNISEDQLNNLKTQFSTSGTSASAVFNNHQLTIQLSVPLPTKKTRAPESTIIVNTNQGNYSSNNSYETGQVDLGNQGETYVSVNNNPDYEFVKFCNGINENQGVNGNDSANKAKEDSDFESPTSLEFVPYNDDHDFLVEAIHMSTSNSFSQITLQETGGFAPQYMGGTDITLQLSMYTQDEQCAASMNLLPSLSAEYARQFRLVLKAWPLKIESEFTKLFGITDTMVESVNVDTIPNYPGLYHISMTLVSVDRTLRNREALQKKDLENFHNLSREGVAAERKWTYDKMSQFLSEAELYPDLELPTLNELAENGFNFIHYSNEHRVYPDPDFYFTYSYVLVSQIIRETVLNALNTDASILSVKDTMGNAASGKITSKSWDKKFVSDATWQKDLEAEFPDDDDYLAARIIQDYQQVDDPERNELWTVAKNIKVAMLEKKMVNRVSDSIKQSYREEKGKASYSNSASTYNNDTNYNRVNTTGNPTAKNSADVQNGASTTDGNSGTAKSNAGSDSGQQNTTVAEKDQKTGYTTMVNAASGKVTELKDPDTKDSNGTTVTQNQEVSEGDSAALKQQQQDLVDKYKANGTANYIHGSGKYSSKINNRCNELTQATTARIDAILGQEIKDTDGFSLLTEIKTVLSAMNTQKASGIIPKAAEAASEALDNTAAGQVAQETLSTATGVVRTAAAMNAIQTIDVSEEDVETFLAAAADAICSNAGVDYTASATTKSVLDAAKNVAEKTVNGGIVGGVAGTVATPVGVGIGTAVGAATGFVDGLATEIAGKGASDKSDQSAPWKHNNKYRATVGIDGMLVPWNFTKNDADCKEKLAYAQYNAIEFGYFNFRYYLPEELEDRFGAYGKISKEKDDQNKSNKEIQEEIDNGTKKNGEGSTEATEHVSYTDTSVTPAKSGSVAVSRYGGYLADPLYRYANIDKQAEYVYNCMTDFNYARAAFLRICLLYMKVLIDYDVFPSFAYDVMRDALDNEDRIKSVINRMEAMKKEKSKKDSEKSEGTKKQGAGGGKWAKKNNKSTEASKDASQVYSAVGTDVPEDNSKKTDESSDGSKKEKSDLGSSSSDSDSSDSQNSSDSGDTSKSADSSNSDDKATAQDKLTDEQEQDAKNSTEADQIVEKYKTLFQANKKSIDRGKLFVMIAMGVLDGDKDFLKVLMDRDYDKLNAISSGCKNGQTIKSNDDKIQYPTKLRSFVRALAGEGAIDDKDIGATEEESPFSPINQYNARKNVAAASMDPSLYLVHSFYDMVVHDCRGRMLRAFPTFYMFMIDEGRTIGKWKLHDNFYNVNAISSITISQSRKIPTDTAEVVMTNFYDTYTTDDEDLNMNYTSNFTDVFDSLFPPFQGEYAAREDERSREAPTVERIRIRPGARIHIRLGYGSDASHLPISFNGIVAEVSTEDTVKLVCQSDGAEICKPILLEKDASEAQGIDEFTGFSDWFENGDTPKNILRSLLCLKGGFWNSKMHNMGWDEFSRLWGDPPNPLGIYHFGNPDVTYAGDQEPVQNIFEIGLTSGDDRYLGSGSKDKFDTESIAVGIGAAIGSVVPGAGTVVGATIGAGVAGAAYEGAKFFGIAKDKEEAPKINFDLFGKSVWDVANICRSCDPEYYAAVLPFHMRSTLFVGRGQDYYAYDYDRIAGSWIEKRKPFQQAHIYTSVTDIINNSIAVSTKDIKTCAVGMYEVQGFQNAKVPKKTEPQWVDESIYPEYQKMMTVDTKLYGAASRKLGKLSDVINWVGAGVTNNFCDRAADDKGDTRSHNRMAVKMTISALKEGMKEMYQGQITVIGDPSVKPQDRMILNDSYNGITGQCLVRDVVQVFSAEQGFKTVITPDLITTQLGKPAEGEMKRNGYATATRGVLDVALTALTYKLSSRAYTKAAEEYKNFKAKAEAEIERAKNVAKKTVGKNSKTRKKNKNKAQKLIDNAEKTAKSVSKTGGKIIDKAKTVTQYGKAAFGGVFDFAKNTAKDIWKFRKLFVSTGIGLAVDTGIGILTDYVSEKVNARKRLIIFPLMKYNRAMVGGIDGNTGIVYGSPNFGKKDAIQTMLSNVVGKLPDWVIDNFFGEDGIINLKNQIFTDEKDKIANTEGLTQLAMSKVNESQINNFSKTPYNPMQTRIEVRDKDAKNKAVKRLGVSGKTVDEINEDSNFKNMQQVFTDPKLKSYIDSGFFRVAAVDKGFTEDLNDKIQCIYLRKPGTNNEYIPVNAITNGNGCYDIPYMHKNASGILDSVIQQSFNYMAGTEQERDPYKWYQDNNGSFITMTSALKCGSTKGYESTGFSCVLTCSDEKSKTALNAAIKSINDQQSTLHDRISDAPEYLIDTKEDGSDVYLLIRPPEGSADS